MGNTAIIYASTSGNTRKTSEYLAKKLEADIFDLKKQSNIDLSAYSKVILGTGIHAGRPYRKVINFYENNKSALENKSVTLFITCLYKGERAGKQVLSIAQDLGISDYTYFSTRGEKNDEGICIDADVFAERMKS